MGGRAFWALNARLREEKLTKTKLTKNEKVKPHQAEDNLVSSSSGGSPSGRPRLTGPMQLAEPGKDQHRTAFPCLGWWHLPEKVKVGTAMPKGKHPTPPGGKQAREALETEGVQPQRRRV